MLSILDKKKKSEKVYIIHIMHKYNVFTHLAGFILFFTVDII